MESLWSNTKVLVAIIIGLSVLAYVVFLYDEGYLELEEPEVTVNYDITTDDTMTYVEIRMWNETDEVKLIDGEGFRIGDRKLMGHSYNILISPYGYEKVELFCLGHPRGDLTYIHEDDVPMKIIRNDDIIP